MAPNLTEFLLARIAEDEAVARDAVQSATDSRWHVHSAHYDGSWVVAGPRDDSCGMEFDHTSVLDETWHAHVNRHDPARVLAECAAKRAIVEEWGTVDPGEWGDGALRHLAAVYAEHSDYDPTWAIR